MSQDRQLQESVMEELGWEPSIDVARIGVTANAGVVTLTGHVHSFAQKAAAEKAAARVSPRPPPSLSASAASAC